MPAISYLTDGDSIGYSRLNALFNEFERKMALLLCGKSPLLVLRAEDLTRNGHLVSGVVYQMSPQRTPDMRTWYVTPGESSYDHTTYADRAAAAVPVTWDDSNRIVWCEYAGVDLDGSLEAHTKEHEGEQYFIGFGDPDIAGFVRPQRRYRYAVAEMVCETLTRLVIPDEWDKFNLFRIHNLNLRESLAVVFGRNHSLTIPAGECRTIRRTAVDGTYEEGRYFWTWRSGDPIGNQMGRVALRNPERTLEACNLTNPSILIRWIELLTSPDVRSAFGWETDPTDLCDLHAISTSYAALFSPPADENSLLGDCVVHRGTMHLVNRPVGGTVTIEETTWRGFGNLPAGLQRVDVGTSDCRIEASGTDPLDIVCTGTNLVAAAGAAASIAQLPIDYPTLASVSYRSLAAYSSYSTSLTWYKPTGEGVEVTGAVTVLESVASETTTHGPMRTIGELVQELAAYESEMEAAALTPEGPRLVIRQPVDISVDGWSLPTDSVVVDGTLCTRSIVTVGTSWPTGNYPDVLGLCGRVDRLTSSLSAGFSFTGTVHWEHPDISGDVISADGSDFVLLDAPRPASRVAIRVQQPIPGPTANGLQPLSGDGWICQNPANPVFHAIVPSDNLGAFFSHKTDGAWYVDNRAALMVAYDYTLSGKFDLLRVPLTFEHYNHLAWRVNALKRCRPLTLCDLYFSIADLVEPGEGGDANTKLTPNGIGLANFDGNPTSIRPLDQFARVDGNAVQLALAQKLGLTLLTQESFPGDWQTAHDLALNPYNLRNWKVQITRTYGTPTTIAGSPSYLQRLVVPGTDRFVAISKLSDDLEYGGVGSPNQPYIYGPQDDYRWLSRIEVETVASALGVKFILATVGRPLRVLVQTSGDPSVTDWSRKESSGTMETEYYDTSGGTDEIDRSRASVAGKTFDISTVVQFPERSVRLLEVDAAASATFIGDGDYLGYSAPRSDSRLDADIALTEIGENSDAGYSGAAPANRFEPYDPFGAVNWTNPSTPPIDLVIEDGIPDTIRSVDAIEQRTLGLFASLVGSYVNESFATLTPAWTWTREPNYTLSSRLAFNLVSTYGVLAREPHFHAADPAQAAIVDVEPRAVVTLPDGVRAAFVRIVPDFTLSLA